MHTEADRAMATAGSRGDRGVPGRQPSGVVFDGRYVQDRYHGIGRYAFHLVDELAGLMPRTQFTVLREPHAPQTRFDWSLLTARPNVTLRDLQAPLFSVREQLALPSMVASCGLRVAGRRWTMDDRLSSIVYRQLSTINYQPSTIYHSPYFSLPWLFAFGSGIVTVHDCIFERDSRYMPRRWARLYFSLLMRSSMARAAFVAVPSRSTARDLRRFYHTPARKIVVTPEAADPSFHPICPDTPLGGVRQRYGLPEKFVMAVGARRPHKNFARLVRAVGQIDDAVLVFVGDADERFEDDTAEAARPLGRRVRFLGKVDEADLPALYNLATVVACPSLIEGFGLPVLEAMACGTPVVCSDIPVFREVAGHAALYAPPQDTVAWTARLQEILADPDLRLQLGRLGLERSAHFTWRRAAEALVPAYRWLGARG